MGLEKEVDAGHTSDTRLLLESDKKSQKSDSLSLPNALQPAESIPTPGKGPHQRCASRLSGFSLILWPCPEQGPILPHLDNPAHKLLPQKSGYWEVVTGKAGQEKCDTKCSLPLGTPPFSVLCECRHTSAGSPTGHRNADLAPKRFLRGATR